MIPRATSRAPAVDPPPPRSGALAIAALALTAFALRGLLPANPRLLEANGILEWFTLPTGLWLPLVLAGSGVLAWRRRARWTALPAARGGAGATGLFAASVAAALWARWTGVDDLWVWALACGGAGLAAQRGLDGLRVQALPLLLLGFALTPPPRLVAEAFWWLQNQSARAATALAQATGAPVLGEGITLTTPTVVFGIVESCTALGIVVVLTAAAVLARETIAAVGARSWWLVALAPAIALLLNLARITAIVLHPPLNGLHHLAQWAILLGLGGLSLRALAALLRRGAEVRLPAPAPATGSSLSLRSALVLAALLAAISLSPVPFPTPAAEAHAAPLRALPMQHAEWVGSEADIDRVFLGRVQFRDLIARRYERGDRTVDLFVGEAWPRNRWTSPFSPKTLLPGLGWVPVDAAIEADAIALRPAPRQLAWIARDGARWTVALWRCGDPGLLRDSLRQLLALDASPFSARDPRWVIRIAAPIDLHDDADGRQAQASIAAFARDFAALLFPDECDEAQKPN